jgi:hypothetical protein
LGAVGGVTAVATVSVAVVIDAVVVDNEISTVAPLFEPTSKKEFENTLNKLFIFYF